MSSRQLDELSANRVLVRRTTKLPRADDRRRWSDSDPAKFGLPWLFYSRVMSRHATDRQTDGHTMQSPFYYAPPVHGGGRIVTGWFHLMSAVGRVTNVVVMRLCKLVS